MFTFFSTLLDHLPQFLILLLLVGVSHYFLLRRHVSSIFDPLFFLLVMNEAFCITDVIFMHLHGLIETRYFIHYFLTEGALFLGLLQFRPRLNRTTPEPLSAAPPSALKFLYLVSLFLFVSLNLLVYSQRGIPLLLDSRLVIYRAGGGWGLVDRLFDVLIPIIMYYLLEILCRRSWRFEEWCAISAVVIIQILSGAKSSVIALLYFAGSYGLFIGTHGSWSLRTGRMLKRLTLAAVASLVLIAFIQSSEGEVAGRRVNVFGQVAVRMVTAGDALIYAYQDRFIEELDGRNPIKAVFKEFLYFFRIIPSENLPKHVGVQITDVVIGIDSNFQTNAKHNIFGYVYFGYWGAILFSYLIGTGIGIVRYVIPRAFPKTWVSGIIFLMLNTSIIISCNDLDNAPRAILGILMIFLPMALLAQKMARLSSRATPVEQ